MGLTIHYDISVPKRWSNETIRAKLEALRQFCMDLPVEEVSDMQEFQGKACEPGKDQDEPFRWAKIQSSRHLESPWHPGSSYRQYPNQMMVFSVDVAPGCEPMNIGVCTFPQFVCPKRTVMEDARTYADMLLNRPAWSLAITNPREYPAAAKVLKQFAKRWNLRRMRFSDHYVRSQETIVRDASYRVCACYGRYQSHRRGYAPSWVLVEMEDRMKDYVRWRFQWHRRGSQGPVCLPGIQGRSQPADLGRRAYHPRPNGNLGFVLQDPICQLARCRRASQLSPCPPCRLLNSGKGRAAWIQGLCQR